MAEHNLMKASGLPMAFIVNIKDRIVHFATDEFVMEGDTITAYGSTNGGQVFTGTIKEIFYSEQSKGRWTERERPTIYKVQLY